MYIMRTRKITLKRRFRTYTLFLCLESHLLNISYFFCNTLYTRRTIGDEPLERIRFERSERVIVGQKSSHPFSHMHAHVYFYLPYVAQYAPSYWLYSGACVPPWPLYFRWSTDPSKTGTLVLAANLTRLYAPRTPAMLEEPAVLSKLHRDHDRAYKLGKLKLLVCFQLVDD